MISYFYKVKSKYVVKEININDWLNLIKNNNIEYIDYARYYGKGTDDYERIKTDKLPCITPNFIYNKVKKDENIIKSTGLLYIDLDINDEIDTEIKKKELKSNEYIYAMWKSLSNKGLSILFKTKGLTKNNFNDFYELIDEMNIPYDKLAKKKSQFNVLSRDKEIFINKESKPLELKIKKRLKTITNKRGNIKGDEPFFELCNSIDYQSNKLITQSILPEYKNDVVFIPEGKLYFSCYIPFKGLGNIKKILNGNRNYVLSTYTNNLILLNPKKSLEELVSHMYMVNMNCCKEPLSKEEIYSMVKNKFNNKENLKPLNPKLKYYWINPETTDKLNKYHEYKKNKTINKINNFFGDDILNIKEKITMKLICKYTGLSLATIKRNITQEQKQLYKELNESRKNNFNF